MAKALDCKGPEGMDAGIGAKATAWTAWGAMAKASAHRCKRDMAWSEDAGRERTKAWMQASRRRWRRQAWNCIGVIMRGTSRSLKATAHQGRGSVTWRIASGRREREGMD